MIARPAIMSWENTFMTAYLLPSRISHSNGSIDTSSRFMEEGGQLTLLVILSTAAALAVVLLLFILIRIACIKKTACFKSYRNKKKKANKEPREQQPPKNGECRDRSSPAASDTVVGPFPSDAAAAQETAATAATGAIQVMSSSAQPDAQQPGHESSSYVIKLIDNDLIVETQEMKWHECDTSSAVADPAGLNALAFKSWLKSNHLEWDSQSMQLETKSLGSSPMKSGRAAALQVTTDAPVDATTQQQQQQQQQQQEQHLASFGLNQSVTSCEEQDERYSYRYGNQVEYMGGSHFPYLDPECGDERRIRPTEHSPASPQTPTNDHQDR